MLLHMSHVFIGLSSIMFLAKISTFPGILIKIMLVFGGVWKLKCGNKLSKTYDTRQENNYLAPFILYLYNPPIVNLCSKPSNNHQHHHATSSISLKPYV